MNKQVFSNSHSTLAAALSNGVTLFGDSISKGLYLENGRICRIERSAVALLQARYSVPVENFSAFGQTLKKCEQKGFFEQFMQTSPHGAPVIALGGNDCDYRWEEVAKVPLAHHEPNTPIEEFGDILERVIARLAEQGSLPIFMSLPPIDSERYFRNVISRRADGERVMEFFGGDVTNIARHQEAYNAVIMQKAIGHGCIFIDFRTQLLLKRNFLEYLSDDGIHPNQKGHEEIAQLIAQFADPIFAGAPAGQTL